MLISTEFGVYRGQRRADVKITCPFCSRDSHVVFFGNNKVETLTDYLSSGISFLTQDLPFEVPIREFLKSGYCRECMELMFGTSSTKIKYVKRERR